MKSNKLLHYFEYNSRTYEKLLRGAEHNATETGHQQLALEEQVLLRLRSIASLQLAQNAAQDRQVQQALQQREQALTQLRQELACVEARIALTLEREHAQQERIDALERQVQAVLAQDPIYLGLARQLEQALYNNQETLSGYSEIRLECASKLPAFEQNPLYRFLRERQFETPQYRANFISRRFDGWLARKVNYRANRRNELSLLSMQARNEQLQLERDAGIAQQVEQTSALQHTAQGKAGMPALQAEMQVLATQRIAEKQQANALHEKLESFSLNQDPHFQRARQWLTEQLQARSIEQLLEDVRKTPDPADDAIALELQALYPQLQQVEQDALQAQQGKHLRAQDYDRAKSLERLLNQADFKLHDYHYSDALDYEKLIADYMHGTLPRSQLLSTLRDSRGTLEAIRGDEVDYDEVMSNVATVAKGAVFVLQVLSSVSSSSSGGGSRGSSGSSSSSSSAGSSGGGGFSTRGSSGGGGFGTSGSAGGGGFRTTDSF